LGLSYNDWNNSNATSTSLRCDRIGLDPSLSQESRHFGIGYYLGPVVFDASLLSSGLNTPVADILQVERSVLTAGFVAVAEKSVPRERIGHRGRKTALPDFIRRAVPDHGHFPESLHIGRKQLASTV